MLIFLALLLLLLLFYLWPRLEANIFLSQENSMYPPEESQKILLFTEYYIPSNPIRREEIDFTLRCNLSNPAIHKVYTIVHSQEEMDSLPKGAYPILVEEKRPTLGQLFKIIREYSGEEDISILANSDIAFDESLRGCKSMSSREAYALTRYEVEDLSLPLRGKLKFLYGTAQDTWIFRGKPNKELENISFTTGTLRCDNRLAYLLNQMYSLKNPCLSIKSYHIHLSEVRTYTDRNVFLVHPLDYEKYDIVPGQGLFIPVST